MIRSYLSPLSTSVRRFTSVPSATMSSSTDPCLFCKISDGKDEKTVLLRDDDGIVVFSDIHPATTHHYLVVPKRHVRNVNELVPDDAELMERLVAAGKNVLNEQGVSNYDDVRMGFHLPPFNGVHHLHLHVLYPVSQMGFLSRVYFRPDSWWFTTSESALRKLEEKSRKENQ